MAENMASTNLDRTNKFYQAGLKNIKAQLALTGTQFVVLRPKENSKWKNVFGGTYSSDSTLENDYDQFTTTLLVNLNDMNRKESLDDIKKIKEKKNLKVFMKETFKIKKIIGIILLNKD